MAEQSKTTRWSKTAVTDAGTSLLTEFAAGRLLTITSAFGSVSDPGENLVELTELPDGREHPLTIESVTRNDDSVTVCIQVTSIGNPEPYKLEQIGIFAAAGGADGPGSIVAGEKLLMVIEDTEDERGGKGVTVPAETDQLYTFKLYAVLTVTNKERLEISVSAAGIATLGAIEDAMKAHEEDPNAHPNLAGKSVGDHNEDPEAHPSLTARMRATERALNGSETILAPEGDPTTETVGKKGQHYINMDTGTEWECAGVNDGEYIWGLVDYDSENYKSMRDILSEAATTAAQAKEVADGAAAAIAAVQNTISVIPSQSGSLTYNGGVKLPSWNNLALEMMTIAYGEEKTAAEDYTGETDAGTYKAYITPKEGYTWGDKSNTERELTWSIKRATIAALPSVKTPLAYTGAAQAPEWLNFNPAQLTKTETAHTDAGDYDSSFAPTPNFQWPDGTTAAKTVPWSIARAVLTVPTQSGTLTYTGQAQSPTLTGYDASKMTLGGDTYKTAAGSYAATVTPKPNFQWPDGSSSAKSVPWSIVKSAGSLSLSPTSATLGGAGEVQVIAVTKAGDGAISATSSNTGIATVQVSGNNVVVTGVAPGSATITVKVAEGTNHLAPSNKTCAITVEAPKIYGAQWDGTSTTKWTRTDAAASFVDPVPYTAGKTAAQCSSPFDNIQPWAGMVKSNRTGGVMVAIPKFWYKLTQSGKSIKVQIANKATAGFSVSPAHMNRGDGKGERDVIYVGRYHCGSNFKSNSGQTPKNNVTRANFRTSIHALGSNIWQMDFATRFTLWLLYLVEFADWNTQKTIGKGCGNNSAPQNMGYTDSMPYHTGTTQSNRDTYGLGTQYRNIEGLWDNVYDFCDGCYNNGSGLNIILNPNSYSDSANGVSVGTPVSGWPSAFSVVNQAGFPMIIPSAAGGGENVASCDYWNFHASYPVVCVGGDCNQDGSRGLFYVSYTSVSGSDAYLGSRLHELP